MSGGRFSSKNFKERRSVSLKMSLPFLGESILEELPVSITLIIYAD